MRFGAELASGVSASSFKGAMLRDPEGSEWLRYNKGPAKRSQTAVNVQDIIRTTSTSSYGVEKQNKNYLKRQGLELDKIMTIDFQATESRSK